MTTTENDLLAIMDEEYDFPTLQPGDVTTAMIRERYNIHENAANVRMKIFAKAHPEFELIKVRNPQTNRIVNALRKK